MQALPAGIPLVAASSVPLGLRVHGASPQLSERVVRPTTVTALRLSGYRKRHHVHEQMRATIQSNIRAAQDYVQTLCTPIYAVDAKGAFEGCGSGIMLDVGPRTFLVTAAHVLDLHSTTSLFLPGRPLVELTGVSHRTFTQHLRRDDKVDLGIVELSSATVAQVTNGTPVSADLIDLSDIPSWLSVYGFVGFPASRNKRRPGGMLQPSSVAIATTAVDTDRYSEVGASIGIHFVGEFAQNEAIDWEKGRVTAPQPTGMSGGGVWRLGRLPELERGVPRPALIGIGIEWHNSKRMLVAVRSSFLVASLLACYPDAGSYLPHMPYVNVSQK